MPENFAPYFTATGIGTLPHPDPAQAVADVLGRLEQMPYWPQLPQRNPCEDMAPQYVSALAPLVSGQAGSRQVRAFGGLAREEALAAFYERLMSDPLESFAPDPACAAGWPVFLEAIGAARGDQYPWLKGHVTGPVTMCLAVPGDDGKSLLYDDEAAEAVARGLGAAAGAQAAELASLGRKAMIFIDEPALSGFGSAFTPVSRETVLGLLGACMEEARTRCDVVLGVHCCGNTDWSLLVDSGADVINLDSEGYGDHLLLYPESVDTLLARGGAVAWGAVPTLEYKGSETAEGLWDGLRALLKGFEEKGLAKERLASQSLVSPACGMGSMKMEQSLAILDLTVGVGRLAREQYL
ncbi:MAG: hypothetical protein K9K66_12270 [Desulfarculaceae bacterium]|nr:hypothetical protein [Desulfarculaceae bacterium]MCF8071730.1 hypothetical protein [Desulfarculaceae bacterium]MCF8102423.1 hypothetical protein [Desulfarculaceae bacterium]MCF8116765.1 hypothetical protein [Desulfarculaceae bacterium]